MPNGGAIERLRNLLDEQKTVASKTTEVEAALAQARKNNSTSLAQQYMNWDAGAVQVKEDLMKEEQTYERLLKALRDMQVEIEERVRPVAEQVVEAEVDRLKTVWERHKSTLNACVSNIDENIMSCRAKVDEYRRMRADLHELNERLSKLGAAPVPVPDELPPGDIGDLIKARIDSLIAQGKI